MLQIKDIRKEYKTGNLVQKALDGVSLNLRDNEFVAILGPSGSGKTTLLNIIGGLDRYDSGDVIINGVSTKKYRDRDWDAYRNHTIGFVFQSYNLIPHQTVLANVELALTISGISGKQRREKALAALDKVGLREQAHKKPNQMSGGQMQRVAIARALVNDPDILLADEPTGALDSDTSVQVMDLLKEVAKDRLVVMVTHNPELAMEYATRIVRVKDGKIIDDSDPFKVEESVLKAPVHRRLGKASMNFFTALALSFNNLLTKKTRTILVAFAGSIGIIGIALIMSLSNGVNKYIDDTEKKTLSQYPIQIEKSSISLMQLMMVSTDTWKPGEPGTVTEIPSVSQILSTVKTNDLISLKDHFDTKAPEIYDLTNGIEYKYSLQPQIFDFDGKTGDFRQVNPNEDFASMGMQSSSMFTSAYSMNVFFELPEKDDLYINQYDIKCGRWPENSSEAVLVLNQNGAVSDYIIYVFGLRDRKELDRMITDFSNGKKVSADQERYTWQYEAFMGKSFKVVPAFEFYKYDSTHEIYSDMRKDKDFMKPVLSKARELKIVGIMQPKDGEDIQMLNSGIYYGKNLVEELRAMSEDAAVVRAQLKDRNVNVLTGVRFDEENEDFDMGDMFSVDENKMKDAFKFDENKLKIDKKKLGNLGNLDFAKELSNAMPKMSSKDMTSLLKNIKLEVNQEELGKLMTNVMNGYLAYASKDPKTNYANMPEAFRNYMNSAEGKALIREQIMKIIKDSVGDVSQKAVKKAETVIMDGFAEYAAKHGWDLSTGNITQYMSQYLSSDEGRKLAQKQFNSVTDEIIGNVKISDKQMSAFVKALVNGYQKYAESHDAPDPKRLAKSFAAYAQSKEGSKLITNGARKAVNSDAIMKQVTKNVNAYSASMGKQMAKAMENIFKKIAAQIGKNITSAMKSTFSNLGDAFLIDKDAMAAAFSMNMDESQLESFMAEMMGGKTTSAESNLSSFGYRAADDLSSITIYPKDFESKDQIVKIIEDYNKSVENQKNEDDEDKSITYTDIVGALMKSVTKIVNTISYVLIAFVAISLVVSSIMIGVITYISVLERRKEIGILRAMGASKMNVAQVFNAETVITGFLAGILGVGISLILLIPGNYLIHTIGDTEAVNAALPPLAAFALIFLSIILTLIGGIIPSKTASKQDPVTALRSE